jgi:hypothetical protein
MIRVIIELWPHGDKNNIETLGVYDIANVGGNHDYGKYVVYKVKGDILRREVAKVNRHERARGFIPLLTKVFRKLEKAR